jgi:hypothetical protein
MMQAAERAQEAAQRAHEAAEAHAAKLRTVSLVAIAVIVVGVLLGSGEVDPECLVRQSGHAAASSLPASCSWNANTIWPMPRNKAAKPT